MYILRVAVPMGLDEERAKALAEAFLESLSDIVANGTEVSYRLSHSDDKNKRNYLQRTESGHPINKDLTMVI